jgi:hypothetical protein
VINGIAYCDCPGFGDSKGFEKDIVNCVAIGRLLQNAACIRLIVTINYETVTSIEGRGSGICGVLNTTKFIFKSDTNELLDIDSMKKMRIIVTNARPCEDEESPAYASISTVRSAIYKQLIMQFNLGQQAAKDIALNIEMVDPIDRIKTGEVKLMSEF